MVRLNGSLYIICLADVDLGRNDNLGLITGAPVSFFSNSQNLRQGDSLSQALCCSLRVVFFFFWLSVGKILSVDNPRKCHIIVMD